MIYIYYSSLEPELYFYTPHYTPHTFQFFVLYHQILSSGSAEKTCTSVLKGPKPYAQQLCSFRLQTTSFVELPEHRSEAKKSLT